MFHLFSVLWDLLRHHRKHWLGITFVLLLCGLALRTGVRQLNAELTRRYERTAASQQPSLQEEMTVRRMRRRTQRLRRSPAATHRAAPAVFPAFGFAVPPVDRVPNWGAMRSADAWTREYARMTAGDFVPLPSYDLAVLTVPMADLLTPLRKENIAALTAKLTYSTRYYGAYDIDAGEFTGPHPGVDIKLPMGTPVGAIGGGRVVHVAMHDDLGLFVMVEHRVAGEGVLYSVYGHLGSTAVTNGADVRPGDTLGTVGMTGKTTAPHLHLQVDRSTGGTSHVPYHPATTPSVAEAARRTVSPMPFIAAHRSGAGNGEL